MFRQLWESGLMQLHVEDKLDWEYQSKDGCQTKAPLGGEATGANPTDRAKRGVKRHLLTETNGLPVGLAVSGANVHDVKKVEDVLLTMPFLPPFTEEEYPQHFCADKGYASRHVCCVVSLLGYEEHIKSRWQEKEEKKEPHYRAGEDGFVNGHIHGGTVSGVCSFDGKRNCQIMKHSSILPVLISSGNTLTYFPDRLLFTSNSV